MRAKSKRGNFSTEVALLFVLIAVTYAAIHPYVGKILKGQVGNVLQGYAGATSGVKLGAGGTPVTLGTAKVAENIYQMEVNDNYQEQIRQDRVDKNQNLSIQSSSLSARAAGSKTVETGVKNRNSVEDLFKQ